MQADSLPPTPALPAAQQWASALSDIERSGAFAGSVRHRAWLRHWVARAQAGDLASLKETVIAVELFRRPASSFDPRLDSIVRVETRRLRQRLGSFYAMEGRFADWCIELPVGSYISLLVRRRVPAMVMASTRQARDLVERGEHFLRLALSRATLEQAVLRFDQALRQSPDHVPALVGLGRAWFNLAAAWPVPPALRSALPRPKWPHAKSLWPARWPWPGNCGRPMSWRHRLWPSLTRRCCHPMCWLSSTPAEASRTGL